MCLTRVSTYVLDSHAKYKLNVNLRSNEQQCRAQNKTMKEATEYVLSSAVHVLAWRIGMIFGPIIYLIVLSKL